MDNKHLVNIAIQHIKDDNPHGIDDIKKGIYSDIDGIHADLNTVKTDVLQVNSKSDSIQSFLDSVKSEVDNLPSVIEARGKLAEAVSLSFLDNKISQEEAKRISETLDALNEAKGYTDVAKIGTEAYINSIKAEVIDYSDTLLYHFEEALGPLAFEDKIELARLGETIIDGGYLKTELIKAHSIGASHINTNELVVGDNITMGPNAVITWDNLSEDSKENLKGEDGRDGIDGEDGSDANVPDYIKTDHIASTTITESTIESPTIIGGTITGGSITSNSTISVTTDAYVGNNLYLGSQSINSEKSIAFNDRTAITGGGRGVNSILDLDAYKISISSVYLSIGAGTTTISNSLKVGEVGTIYFDPGGEIDFENASVLNFSGNSITRGTVAFARLPTGTSSTRVAVGNHTHSQYLANSSSTISVTRNRLRVADNSYRAYVFGKTVYIYFQYNPSLNSYEFKQYDSAVLSIGSAYAPPGSTAGSAYPASSNNVNTPVYPYITTSGAIGVVNSINNSEGIGAWNCSITYVMS